MLVDDLQLYFIIVDELSKNMFFFVVFLLQASTFVIRNVFFPIASLTIF